MNDFNTQWRSKPLGDICNIVGGGTPSKKNDAFYDGDIPWATVRDMNEDIITETSFKITKDAVKNSSTNIIEAGNVVIATRVGLGKVCLLNQDTAINQDLRAVMPKKNDTVSVPFLFWWLKSIAHVIEQEGTGATVKGVKLPFVKSLPLPLPPLPEQQRIVSILDEVFEGIGKAVANVERNIENSRELFKSYLARGFIEMNQKYGTKSLGNICSIIGGGTPSKKNDAFYNGNIPWATVRDMNNDVLTETSYHITDVAVKSSSTNIIKKENVIIATRVGLGKVCLLGQDTAINQDLRGIIPIKKDRLSIRFLFWWFKSMASFIEREGTGATVKGVKLTFVKSLKIPLPPFAEQNILIEKIDLLRKQTQKLEIQYKQNLTDLEELKQSILQKAFTGELTAKTVDKIMEPV